MRDNKPDIEDIIEDTEALKEIGKKIINENPILKLLKENGILDKLSTDNFYILLGIKNKDDTQIMYIRDTLILLNEEGLLNRTTENWIFNYKDRKELFSHNLITELNNLKNHGLWSVENCQTLEPYLFDIQRLKNTVSIIIARSKYHTLHTLINNTPIRDSLLNNNIPVDTKKLNNLLSSIEEEYKRAKNSNHETSTLSFLTQILEKTYQCCISSMSNLEPYKKLIDTAPYRKYSASKVRVGYAMYALSSFFALAGILLVATGLGAPLGLAFIPFAMIIGNISLFTAIVSTAIGRLLKNLGQAQTIMKNMNQFYESIPKKQEETQDNGNNNDNIQSINQKQTLRIPSRNNTNQAISKKATLNQSQSFSNEQTLKISVSNCNSDEEIDTSKMASIPRNNLFASSNSNAVTSSSEDGFTCS